MAYLGRGLDKISNIEVLDNITFDGSSSYSITKSSVAFVPNSAQSLLISIDGVVQATNFSVSTSTIDFGVAIPSTSTCDFFLHYGTGVMTVPSDGSVTTAKLGDSAVTTAKINDGAVTSAKLSSGKVLQVVSTTKTDTFSASITSGSSADITGLSLSITPSSSSSKVLILLTVNGHNGSEVGVFVNVKRNGTVVASHDDEGGVSYDTMLSGDLGLTTSTISSSTTGVILDTPSTTSAITYQATIISGSVTTRTHYVNRPKTTGKNYGISTITAMEISG